MFHVIYWIGKTNGDENTSGSRLGLRSRRKSARSARNLTPCSRPPPPFLDVRMLGPIDPRFLLDPSRCARGALGESSALCSVLVSWVMSLNTLVHSIPTNRKKSPVGRGGKAPRAYRLTEHQHAILHSGRWAQLLMQAPAFGSSFGRVQGLGCCWPIKTLWEQWNMV